jgi:transposase-like protein
LSATSTRRTLRKFHRAAVDLALLLDGSTAGELLTELARYAMQQLIKLEVADVFGTDCHERTEERLGYRNGYRPRSPHHPSGGPRDVSRICGDAKR